MKLLFLCWQWCEPSNKIFCPKMNWAHTRCAWWLSSSAFTLNIIDPIFAPIDCIWPVIVGIWNLMKKIPFAGSGVIEQPATTHLDHNAPVYCKEFSQRSHFDVIRPFRAQTLFSRPWHSKYRFLASLRHDISGNIYLLKECYTLFWSSRYDGFIDRIKFFWRCRHFNPAQIVSRHIDAK